MIGTIVTFAVCALLQLLEPADTVRPPMRSATEAEVLEKAETLMLRVDPKSRQKAQQEAPKEASAADSAQPASSVESSALTNFRGTLAQFAEVVYGRASPRRQSK